METEDLQRILIALGYDVGPAGADGAFGRNTITAVKAFQRDRRVEVQYPGTVGPKTIAALEAAAPAGGGKKSGGAAPGAIVPLSPLLPWMEEAKRLQGVRETAGTKSNSVILAWAKALGGFVRSYYTSDDIPWCGLFVAHCVGLTLPSEALPSNPLSALAWAKFGVDVKPTPGAVLVFSRTGGGHVGFYLGEDDAAFHVLGGNQSDQVNITRVAKDRHVATRWPATADRPTAGRLRMTVSGALSRNEA